MKYRSQIVLAVLGSFGVAQSSFAAGGYRLAAISEIQTSASASGAGQLVYVAQSDVAWLGSPNCPTAWAFFNAKDNPYFAATVLAAQTAGKAIRIYVDDSLPKSGGHCQISTIASF